MGRSLLDMGTILALGVVGLLTWLGQQKPPDRYLEKIETSGVLRVGVDPSYPPFEVVTQGKVEGYDAELAGAIASQLGVRVEFQALALDTLYDALQAGKVDLLVSALPFIYERQKDVKYSTPYYQAGQVLVVRKGEEQIHSVADLREKRVGVELGSSADTQARLISKSSVQSMLLHSIYHSPEEALNALTSGQIDAVITDNTSAQSFEQEHADSVVVLSPPITDEPYVVAMPAGATGLSARVDAIIGRMRASGELARIMGAGR